MTLVFGSDHAGFTLRKNLVSWARNLGHDLIEVGATTMDAFDYPDAADAVCLHLLHNQAALGVLICGSGIGVAIRANRYDHIRAACCYSVELATLARMHNHANILCLGERITGPELAQDILATFLSTEEDHAERHERRIHKLDAPLISG